MTFIKICGIRTEEQALAAARGGANFIGFVLAPSPRQVTPAAVRKMTAVLKKHHPGVKTVGVFVNMPAPVVQKMVDACGLDWAQIHGTEPWELCKELARPVIKVARLARRYSPDIICETFEYGQKLLAGQDLLFMLDTSAKDKYGGTGLTFDWNQARQIAARYPVIIAGGLNPENVGAAINTIRPCGVYVSTGIETSGVKDLEKMKKFIEAVRQCDAVLS